MGPKYMLRLDDTAFDGAHTACDGWQVSAVISAIGAAIPDLNWYASDTLAIGPGFAEARGATPVRVGTSQSLSDAAAAVTQFERGVFAGVPAKNAEPRFRDQFIWTDDDDDADLLDSLVEVRAFDTTYILVLTCDARVVDALKPFLDRATSVRNG